MSVFLIIVSDDFERAYGKPLHPLGRHEVHGLATPHDLFTPTLPLPGAG
jgi:hypothetical protein